MKVFHSIFALAALAFLPGISTAGLINYAYQVTGTISPLPPGDPGAGQVVIPQSNGVVSTEWYNSNGISSFYLNDWSSLNPTPSELAANHGLFITRFTFQVSIIDLNTGQTGEIDVPGTAITNWTKLPDGTWQFFGASLNAESGYAMNLGGTQYTINSGFSWQFGGSAPVEDYLFVTTTPEPGTLMLAAVGFPLLGIVVRKRRGSTSVDIQN